jgi:hypothetical protein
MPPTLLYLVLLCVLPPCLTLTVYFTNTTTSTPTTLTIPSVYATVGDLPTTTHRFNHTIIMQHQTCHFDNFGMTGYADNNDMISDTADYAFVYTGDLRKDMFLSCNTFDKGSGVTVARLAQGAGASFVVIGAALPVCVSRSVL